MQTSLSADTSPLRAYGLNRSERRPKEILDRANFHACVGRICRNYYAPAMDSPSFARGFVSAVFW